MLKVSKSNALPSSTSHARHSRVSPVKENIPIWETRCVQSPGVPSTRSWWCSFSLMLLIRSFMVIRFSNLHEQTHVQDSSRYLVMPLSLSVPSSPFFLSPLLSLLLSVSLVPSLPHTPSSLSLSLPTSITFSLSLSPFLVECGVVEGSGDDPGSVVGTVGPHATSKLNNLALDTSCCLTGVQNTTELSHTLIWDKEEDNAISTLRRLARKFWLLLIMCRNIFYSKYYCSGWLLC